jgi:hypothetical protein
MKKRTTYLLLAFISAFLLNSRVFANQPIDGTVSYHYNLSKPVPSVTVELYTSNGVKIDETTTDNLGQYTFSDVPTGTYVIKGVYTSIEPGGFDLGDAADILLYALRIKTPSEIQKLASDLNHNNKVDLMDFALWFMNWNDSFDPEWVFENITITHDGTKTNVPTISGSSSGDVNGTFVPSQRNEPAIEVQYVEQRFTENFSLPVYAKDLTSASAMGLVIDYPDFINVTDVTSPLGNFIDLRIENNQIVASWVNDNFEDMAIDPSQPVALISGSVNSKYNGSDIKLELSNKSHFLKSGEAVRPAFAVPYLSIANNDFISHSYPNPANDVTTIYFELPYDTEASLSIYNLTGQLVKTVFNERLSAGQHSVEIPVSDLKDGIYLYNLKSENGAKINQTKRLVVVH